MNRIPKVYKTVAFWYGLHLLLGVNIVKIDHEKKGKLLLVVSKQHELFSFSQFGSQYVVHPIVNLPLQPSTDLNVNACFFHCIYIKVVPPHVNDKKYGEKRISFCCKFNKLVNLLKCTNK